MMAMNKEVEKLWKFRSSSNPDKLYETLLYVDGSTSCDCPGWCRRAERTCKHTRSVAAGTADMECVASHQVSEAQPQPKQKTAQKQATLKAKFELTPARKVLWKE